MNLPQAPHGQQAQMSTLFDAFVDFPASLDSGIRRGEALALNWEDLDFQTGSVLVRRGKGRKARITYVGAKGSPVFLLTASSGATLVERLTEIRAPISLSTGAAANSQLGRFAEGWIGLAYSGFSVMPTWRWSANPFSKPMATFGSIMRGGRQWTASARQVGKPSWEC